MKRHIHQTPDRVVSRRRNIGPSAAATAFFSKAFIGLTAVSFIWSSLNAQPLIPEGNHHLHNFSNRKETSFHALAMGYSMVCSVKPDGPEYDSLGLILNSNARIGPIRIYVHKASGAVNVQYHSAYNIKGTHESAIASQYGLKRTAGVLYPLTEEDWFIVRSYSGTRKNADQLRASEVTESTFDSYFAKTWPLEDQTYRSFNLGANWQSRKVVDDFVRYKTAGVDWKEYAALFMDGINNLDVANPVNLDFGGMGHYPTSWEGKNDYMIRVAEFIRNTDSTGSDRPLLLVGNIWNPKSAGGLRLARLFAAGRLRFDHYYFEQGGIGNQLPNGVIPGTLLPAYVDPDSAAYYIPASRVALDDVYGFNKDMSKYDRTGHFSQHLDACGTAGLHGALFGWYGEDGVTRVDSQGKLIYTNDLQLLRAIPNWDNLHGIPVPAFGNVSEWDQRRWNHNVYSSPTSHASDSLIWSLNPFNGEFYVVFRRSGALLPLDGKRIKTAYWTDDWFRATDQSARVALDTTGGLVKLKADDESQGLGRGIRITFLDPVEADLSKYRDPFKWPFASDCIWNVPIGSEARFVDAGISPQTAKGAFLYHDIVIMTPDEPPMEVYAFPGGWSSDRCVKADFLGKLPIPDDFFVPFTGDTKDHPVGILEQDYRTVNQSQPFHRCTGAPNAMSKYWGYQNVDLYGDGRLGAHGGSALSSIGGTIRLGEFTAGVIPHALKLAIWGEKYYYFDKENDDTPGYQWPAIKADGYAESNYGGTNPALQMGSLLALKQDFDTSLCATTPGRIIAQALKDYGGYIVDDAAWDVFKIPVEWGPEGRVDEEFRELYGFDWDQQDRSHPFSKDLTTIFTNLLIVDNSGPDSVGGGGNPLVPSAPDFLPTRSLTVESGTTGAQLHPAGTFTVPMGKTCRLRVLENPPGHRFIDWSIVSGYAFIANEDSSLTPVELEWEDATIRANFTPLTYTLTTTVIGNGMIEQDTSGKEFEYGTQIILTAVPDSGFVFRGWSGDVSSFENPLSISIEDHTSITATFTRPYYKLIVGSSSGGTYTAVPDADSMLIGTPVTLTAVADPGWTFLNWTGHLTTTENPLELVMDRDWILYATFDSITVSDRPGNLYPGDNAGWLFRITSDPASRSLVFRSADPNVKFRISIYDLNGKQVQALPYAQNGELRLNISEFHPGIYLARCYNQEGLHKTLKLAVTNHY